MKSAFVFHDHTVNLRIKIVETARLGRRKNIDRVLEIRKFGGAHRCKSWVARGGADRVRDDLFTQRVFDRIDRADTAAQIAVTRFDGNEATGAGVE